MRKLLVLMALASSILAGVSLAGQGTKKGPVVPRKAPEFVIKMANGEPQQLLSPYKGKTVIFAFMYTTCPHCQNTARFLTGLQKDYPAKDGQGSGVTFDDGAANRVQQF